MFLLPEDHGGILWSPGPSQAGIKQAQCLLFGL